VELIATPGHSPGHICLHFPRHRAFISGDHIIEGITPNIGYSPGHDALGEYLESLNRVSAMDFDLIVPSHGAPFRGHREWIAATRNHHAKRCAEIEAALPATPAELVSRLWPRELTAFHYRFAVFEVLAHLEHMKRRS
jgi:glyoxylase-like metal-dependent hydrolase (beta-lactamase superfamily II)